MYGTRPVELAARLRTLGVALADPDEWRSAGCWLMTGAGVCTRGAQFVAVLDTRGQLRANVCPAHAEIVKQRAAQALRYVEISPR